MLGHAVGVAVVEAHQASEGGGLVESSLADLWGDADDHPACGHTCQSALYSLAGQACSLGKFSRAPRMIQFA